MDAPSATTDFFAELDKEIASITAKANLKTDAKKLKAIANDRRLSAWKRKEAAAEYETLRSIIEETQYRAIASGALFTEQHCDGCDSTHYNFLQYMQLEEKVSQPSTKRWIRVSVPDASLPRETIVQPIVTHMCASCAAEHGFDVAAPSIRLMPSIGNLTVSSTYVQGDINGSPTED